jgi:hypothetical protein
VLEVACTKVRRTLAGPDPDVERLTRIHDNLKETLGVCRRAKQALDRCESLPEGLGEDLSRLSLHAGPDQRSRSSRGAGVEMTSPEEARRFEELGPIDPREVRATDLNDLARRLLEADQGD